MTLKFPTAHVIRLPPPPFPHFPPNFIRHEAVSLNVGKLKVIILDNLLLFPHLYGYVCALIH